MRISGTYLILQKLLDTTKISPELNKLNTIP